jgi:hypothetical protein
VNNERNTLEPGRNTHWKRDIAAKDKNKAWPKVTDQATALDHGTKQANR